jgi:hypothetical protein
VSEAPDYAGTIEGWRLWLAVQKPDTLQLASLVYDVVWSPGKPLVAACFHRQRSHTRPWCKTRPTHAAPDPSCQCGIYAIDDPCKLNSYLDSSYFGRRALHRVVGRVSLWGTVIECERGWRATYAYPAHLYVPLADPAGAAAEYIAEKLSGYGVPIEIVSNTRSRELLGALAAATEAA